MKSEAEIKERMAEWEWVLVRRAGERDECESCYARYLDMMRELEWVLEPSGEDASDGDSPR